MRTDVLILGANSYIAQNIVPCLSGRSIVTSGRSAPNEVCREWSYPHVSADLCVSEEPLLEVRPRELWIFARPLDEGAVENLAFYHHLKLLTFAYLSRLHLRRVVLFSTQLVYGWPADARPMSSDHRLDPRGVYDYAKADMEFYLRCLHHQYGLQRVDILRLPLAFGGRILAAQREIQLLYSWLDAHRDGARWSDIATAAPEHGTSWVHVDDLAAALAADDAVEGIRIRNASSGELRYAALHALAEQLWGKGTPDPAMWRPRTAFYITDDLGLPRRDWAEAVRSRAWEDANGSR